MRTWLAALLRQIEHLVHDIVVQVLVLEPYGPCRLVLEIRYRHTLLHQRGKIGVVLVTNGDIEPCTVAYDGLEAHNLRIRGRLLECTSEAFAKLQVGIVGVHPVLDELCVEDFLQGLLSRQTSKATSCQRNGKDAPPQESLRAQSSSLGYSCTCRATCSPPRNPTTPRARHR